MGVDFVRAATEAGIGKVVYSGVDHPSLSLPNHAGTRPIEEALCHSELDYTIVQPAMFMQAFDSAYDEALSSGRVTFPWSKESKMTHVDYRDVAEVAAIAFSGDSLSYGTFEPAADGMVTRDELAELIGQVIGGEVEGRRSACGLGQLAGPTGWSGHHVRRLRPAQFPRRQRTGAAQHSGTRATQRHRLPGRVGEPRAGSEQLTRSTGRQPANPGRSQTSPKSTSSVRETSLSAKPPRLR